MKKFLIALVAMFGITAGVSAKKTEVYASYGGYTQMDATDCHDGGPSVNTAWGALTAGVNFKITPKIWIGPSYTFSSTSRKKYDDNNFYYHAIMFNGRYGYYQNNIVSMYAKLGIGAIITHETWPDDSKNYGHFAYQISPLCAQVAINKTFSMFGELGFGAQGLLQVGFKMNL